LSTPNSTSNATTILWADWASSTGITTSTTIATCDNATSLSVGDLNGDGDQDIVVFSTVTSQACVHLANASSFDPVSNITLSSGLIGGAVGDINGDGIINILDVVQAVNLILGNFYQESADLNDDGIINVLDIVQIVNIILN
jgi:hypothetical protein